MFLKLIGLGLDITHAHWTEWKNNENLLDLKINIIKCFNLFI
jgi:hypothetical protein